MYDVIVVGAGPAGSSTAYHCAKKGWKVLLLDKKKQVGLPKQCGEGINKKILKVLSLELKPEWISQEIDSLVIFNFKNYFKLGGRRNQGFVLDRKKFDPGLVKRAEEAGAEVRLGCGVTDLTEEGVVCKGEEIKGKIIVGADGPNTLVGEKSGLGKPKCGFGLQYEIQTTKTSFPKSLQFYFDQSSKYQGYFWIFPKKETLNIGIGEFQVCDLKPALNNFIKKLSLEKERILETNAGLIPMHGPLEKFCNERVLLVGDAAGHTNPLSGGGVPVAIFDGILASEMIDQHLRRNHSLTDYQKEWWQSGFGKATLACFKFRKLLSRYLEKDHLNLLLSKLDNQEINTKKDLLRLAFKIPFLDVIKLLWYGKAFMKYYHYTW